MVVAGDQTESTDMIELFSENTFSSSNDFHLQFKHVNTQSKLLNMLSITNFEHTFTNMVYASNEKYHSCKIA